MISEYKKKKKKKKKTSNFWRNKIFNHIENNIGEHDKSSKSRQTYCVR